MASGQFITSKLMRTSNDTPWGFRLQGGKEFQTPLSIVKVASGSLADQTGIQVGDIILKINGRECEQMRHKEAQEVIIAAGNYLELYLERGSMNTWRPSVTPVGDVCAKQPIYTQTSLAKSPEKCAPIGTGHNSTAKPFAVQSQPALVHKQYNSPVNLYSERNIEETLNAHTQVLSSGATGINFMRPDAPVNKESAVYQMVHDEEMRKTKGISSSPDIRNNGYPVSDGSAQSGVIKHVEAPVGKPNTPTAPDASRNICSECERLIVGVFVRVNNKPLHADCFRCATCGTSLKNIGYFNVNDKLYCDIHARQVKTLMGVGGNPVYSSPAPLMDNQYTNGHATQNGFHSTSAPYPNKPEAGPPQPETNSVSYQSNVSASQNGFQNVSSPKKYSSVTPPSAPRSNYSQNRNSMYVNPSTISSETHTTGNSKFNWPPPGTGENVVTYRQNTQYQNRPKSCYSSLPSAYSVTSSTYSTTTNYNSANQVDNANVANYPKTAMYASSTQTTISSQPGLDAKPLAQTSYVPGSNPTRQWSSSGASFGKSTVSDSRSAPKRGRGLLQSQLSGGVIPFCGYCSQPIRGQYIMALNKTWCPNHFVCANALCKRSLEQNGFVEEQGRLYCETCYETHFAPTCSKCNQRIKGDCLNALDRQWHPNCFTCSYCKKPFGNSSFYLEDGHPYCEKDWNDLFTTKCVGCGYPIAAGDRWVEALNQNYHSNCFRCTVCRGNLEGQSFFAKGGRPYCKAHAR